VTNSTPERALQIGLVQEVVPAGQQVARASEIAHRIAGNAPIGIRAMKEAALKFIQTGEAMAIAGIPADSRRGHGHGRCQGRHPVVHRAPRSAVSGSLTHRRPGGIDVAS
jgi:Enoyl-CoA hydratase/carnithine racemase